MAGSSLATSSDSPCRAAASGVQVSSGRFDAGESAGLRLARHQHAQACVLNHLVVAARPVPQDNSAHMHGGEAAPR